MTSFDAGEFREQLAKTLEVKNVSDIVIEVQSASVNVDALVVVPTYSEAQTATSILNEFVDDPDKGTGVLGFPLESVKPVQVETGCLICIPPSPSAPPPLAPPPPPDWPLISLALGLGIIGLCIIACVCWYYAIPKIIAPKLRKKKTVEVTADAVNSMIEMGTGSAGHAEDLDPELEMNPVAVENLKRAKQKEMEKKRRAAKAKKEAAKKGVVPKLRRSVQSSGFIVAGAFAKLGITIAAKPGGEANDSGAEASRDPKKIDLKSIDIEMAKRTEKLKKQEADELAAAEKAREAEAEKQAREAPSGGAQPPGKKKAGKKKAGGALGKLGLGGGCSDVSSTSTSSGAAGPPDVV